MEGGGVLESDSRSGCTRHSFASSLFGLFLHKLADFWPLWSGDKVSLQPHRESAHLSPRPHLAKVPTVPLEDEAGAARALLLEEEEEFIIRGSKLEIPHL